MLSIVMNVLFQIIPDNATSKYKLTRQCNFQVQVASAVYHSHCFETYVFVISRTDSHSHDTQFTPSTTTTVLALSSIDVDLVLG